ncbi:MAG: flp pilus-assembly TadE/G-like family protein [Actinomycetota bacterium]|nr:flp pilus-assembly TadE/G-like family protein [Actinomycetota bacterium]
MRASSRAGSDEGAGTVLAVGLVAMLGSLVLACAALGAAVVSRHRAASAADLAALAGSDRALGRATGEPCQAAASVARANATQLTSCRVDADGSVTVSVQVRLPPPWTTFGPAEARSRAGPAPP